MKNHNIFVTSTHRHDVFLVSNASTIPQLKDQLSVVSGIPAQCMNFYGYNEDASINHGNFTMKFDPMQDHVFLRVKLNALLSKHYQVQRYNNTIYLHTALKTGVIEAKELLQEAVQDKFHLNGRFNVYINKCVSNENTLSDLLSKGETRIIDVVITEQLNYRAF